MANMTPDTLCGAAQLFEQTAEILRRIDDTNSSEPFLSREQAIALGIKAAWDDETEFPSALTTAASVLVALEKCGYVVVAQPTVGVVDVRISFGDQLR